MPASIDATAGASHRYLGIHATGEIATHSLCDACKGSCTARAQLFELLRVPADAFHVGYSMPVVEESNCSAHHGTVAVEGLIEAPASRVFAAFSDPKTREAWGAPSDTATFYYEEADFRVGGRDIARCGAKTNPRSTVESRYVDIVPERRVVWTETICEGDKKLAVNFTTLELLPDVNRTGHLVCR